VQEAHHCGPPKPQFAPFLTLANATGAERLTLDAPLRGVRMPRSRLFGGDSAVDSEAMRSAVLISRLQRHHPVEIDQLVKLAYLQRRDVLQSRILGPRRGISD
jgi:hypothetical protein